MQLRISPGGRMRFSRRRRPELPPSSVTVTMAVRSLTGLWWFAQSSRRRVTYSFRPRNRVESPVPPPRATTLRPRKLRFDLEGGFFTGHSNRQRFSTESAEEQSEGLLCRETRRDSNQPAVPSFSG